MLFRSTDAERDFAPHVGDQNDILQCLITANFAEHVEIPPGDSGKPSVGDAVNIDNAGKLRVFLISIKKFSLED